MVTATENARVSLLTMRSALHIEKWLSSDMYSNVNSGAAGTWPSSRETAREGDRWPRGELSGVAPRLGCGGAPGR
jgi:hypothetical protein